VLLDDAVTQTNLAREWANPLPYSPQSFNAWSFAAAGLKSPIRGAFDVMANFSDLAASAMEPSSSHLTRRSPQEQARDALSSQAARDAGRALRLKADQWSPDPETAHAADQIISSLGAAVTKAVGAVGTLGPVAGGAAFGLGEGDTTYQRLVDKGVDPTAAAKVAAVTGVASGVGTVLPMAGPTIVKTLGLVAAGGPGLYAAQEELAKRILQQAGETKEAATHDPLDPLGLALSLAIPGLFGGMHIRSLMKKGPHPELDAAAADATTVDAARVKVTEDHLARVLPDAPFARLEMFRAIDAIGAGERPDVPTVAHSDLPDTAAPRAAELEAAGARTIEVGTPIPLDEVGRKSAQADMVSIRKRLPILKSLLECLDG
jgi:hypothetical protein